MRAVCLTLAALLAGTSACASPPGTTPQPVVVARDFYDTRGHHMQTMTDGTSRDLGVPNARQAIALAALSTSGVQAMVTGQHFGWITGSASVPTLTVQLPPSPQVNDSVRLASSVSVGMLTVQDATGAAVASYALPPYAVALMVYGSSGWQLVVRPATLYTDGMAVAAVLAAGGVFSVNGVVPDASGNVTIPTQVGATGPAGAPGAAGPAGPPGQNGTTPTIPSSALLGGTGSAFSLVAVGSGLSLSGGTLALAAAPLTLAQVQAALALGSAAYQPSSAFDAAGAASTERTRALAAEAALAPLVSPALTGTPTVPTAPSGTATTQAASTAFVQAAVGASGKLFFGTGTTTASGTFTVTISPACSAPPTIIVPGSKAAGTLLSNATNASWTSSTANSVSGIVTAPATLSVGALGLTVIAPPTGTPVSVLGLCP